MQRRTRVLVPLGIAMSLTMALMFILAQPSHAGTYTVTEITDDGSGTTIGTLSWAISSTNGSAGLDYIDFNLDSGSAITVTGALPALTDDAGAVITATDGGR